MLTEAGFTDIVIEKKEKAAEVIKDWMPESGAEKVVTSAYVRAVKPQGERGIQDNVRVNVHQADVATTLQLDTSGPKCGPGV